MTSVYIHIPFCERICTYCDFPKRVGTSKQMNDYMDALLLEVEGYQVKESLQTLYIGGGTPSILTGDKLAKLKEMIGLFNLAPDYEFTIECNPEHITAELVQSYIDMGVNRISLGVQTFNNKLLRLLNRGHTKEQVYHAIDIIRENGIHNITIDLIFSLPMQTMDLLEEDLHHIKQLNIEHVSCYSLILEDKTVLSKLVNDNKVTLLENELEAEMYERVITFLKDLGFHHYEISNFGKPGFESKHNTVYWKNNEYYGFGMGASGYINGVRYYNQHLVTPYIESINKKQTVIEHQDELKKDDQIKEALMLGLRLIEGVCINEVNERYSIDVLDYFKKEFERLQSKNWIIIDDRIRLSHEGLFYGNEVFGLFI